MGWRPRPPPPPLTRTVKIAILSTMSGYSWAGTEEVWHGFADRALSSGHEVVLAADHEVAYSNQTNELVARGMEVSSRKPSHSPRINRLKSVVSPDHADLEKFAPDVLLINAGSPYDLHYNPNLQPVVGSLGCRKVFFCHFNSDRLVPEPPSSIFDDIDHFVFVAEQNRKQMEIQLARHLSNSSVLLNRSRLELPSPIPFPPSSNVTFANIARLETRWKGQDLIPQILADEAWKSRELAVVCYGSGPEESYLQKLIAMHDVGGALSLGGYSRDLEKTWADCHALILPSRGEGTPLVAIEAMMCGRPVIATDVGGISEIVEDGETGFIAEAPTVKSFSAAMERAWARRDEWPAMGDRAHAKAKELAKADPIGGLTRILEELVAR